jgi:uncharacterized protein
MKIKSFFFRIMPDRAKILGKSYPKIFHTILEDPNIFHLTRRSAAGGVSTGLFIAFLPVPGHTLLAVIFSIALRVNLPLCLFFAWTTNPLTLAPIYYIAYRLGSAVLGIPVQAVDFEMSWDWFGGQFIEIWPPLIIGCAIFSVVSSITSYVLIRIMWRIGTINKWKNRSRSCPEVKAKN